MSRKTMEQLQSAPSVTVLTRAMHWLHAFQSHEQGVAVASAAMVFLFLCLRFRVNPRRALEVAERQLRDAAERQPVEVRAVRATLKDVFPHD